MVYMYSVNISRYTKLVHVQIGNQIYGHYWPNPIPALPTLNACFISLSEDPGSSRNPYSIPVASKIVATSFTL